MKKILFSLLIFLLMVSAAWADSYEAITVAGTAIGLTPATYAGSRWGICRLETAEIRYTKDGVTTPTNAVGVPVEPFEWIVLDNRSQLRNFRAIRTTGTSGSLKCHYFSE